MIVWLNGTFGAGKTTTAAELQTLMPGARVFDPETVGYMLMANLADRPVEAGRPVRMRVMARSNRGSCGPESSGPG